MHQLDQISLVLGQGGALKASQEKRYHDHDLESSSIIPLDSKIKDENGKRAPPIARPDSVGQPSDYSRIDLCIERIFTRRDYHSTSRCCPSQKSVRDRWAIKYER
jgi:hypothetical protein